MAESLIATLAEFNQLTTDLHNERKAIQMAKRSVYTAQTADIYRNFRIGGAMTNSTTGADLAHHLIKQANAVCQLLVDPNCTDTEKDARFADLMNYTELAYVLYKKNGQHEKFFNGVEAGPTGPF